MGGTYMTFGEAINAAKSGKKIQREGWLASQSDMLATDWKIFD